MSPARYEQFCPLARAAEILGERWTLLVVRELFCGPQRFTDLRRRLPGLSSSVLSERLARLEERGLVARRDAPPPAPAVLYELTPLGQTLRPVVLELVRFGLRFLGSKRPGDHLEPSWLRVGLEAVAARRPTPRRAFTIRMRDVSGDVVIHLSGGPRGVRVREGEHPADVTLRLDPVTLFGVVGGAVDPAASEAIGIEGDPEALRDLPAMFDLPRFVAGDAADAVSPTKPRS